MKEPNKNNLLPILSVFVVVLVLIAGAYWFGTHSKESKSTNAISDVRDLEDTGAKKEKSESDVEKESDSNQTKEEIKDADLDKKEDVEEKSVDESNESIVETLTLLLAQKYEKKTENIKVTISKREGNYVIGGVSFSDEASGGMLFAAKVNGAWKIVHDGNGTCSCSALNIVDFPKTLVGECLDDDTSEIVIR